MKKKTLRRPHKSWESNAKWLFLITTTKLHIWYDNFWLLSCICLSFPVCMNHSSALNCFCHCECSAMSCFYALCHSKPEPTHRVWWPTGNYTTPDNFLQHSDLSIKTAYAFLKNTRFCFPEILVPLNSRKISKHTRILAQNQAAKTRMTTKLAKSRKCRKHDAARKPRSWSVEFARVREARLWWSM